MKQLFQNLKSGETMITDVPSPRLKAGHLLVRTESTLVSAGTERMLVDFSRANMIAKARKQPEKVKMVWDKVKTDGLLTTVDAVRSKLDQPLPLGYCNVGTVLEVGEGVQGFSVGDRVVSNGNHAEVVCVSKNLCAKIPAGITSGEAAFTVLAAIGLQGVRLAKPTLGESFVVTGLGLIGLLTVQILRANGCRVLGIDYQSNRLELARRWGAATVDLSKGEDPVASSAEFSAGRGVDGVIITASTSENGPVQQAAHMCRKRGRIVLVGVAGLDLSRDDFYKKELSFQVSCSYGPGRYDPQYEEKGNDYPFEYVRWTEQRNFEAILQLLAEQRLNAEPLISYRFKLEDAGEAYEIVSSTEPSLGIVLDYGTAKVDASVSAPVGDARRVSFPGAASRNCASSKPTMGFVGAGNYAGRVLIPAFSKTGATLKTLGSSGGASGVHYGKKYDFADTTTDVSTIFSDREIDTVVIATRHDTHACFTCQAIEAGKNVFVEKPLCLTEDELDSITRCYESSAPSTTSPLLMVGFNRRYSPHIQKIKSLLSSADGVASFVYTVNAGFIPADHWTQDVVTGGGRVIGECCHFVDLLRYLADAPIVSAQRSYADAGSTRDTITITLSFANGSIGTIHYFANGHSSFPKERLEVFCGGRVLQLDNYRKLSGYGWNGFKKMNLLRQDKGQRACAEAFVDAIRKGGANPIPFDEIVEVARTSIGLASS